MADMQQQQPGAIQWNDGHQQTDTINTIMAPTSNQSMSNPILNNNFPTSTYGYQQSCNQTPQTVPQSKSNNTLNRPSTSNNFSKNDLLSSIQIDSIIPSLTSVHVQQGSVKSTQLVQQCQSTAISTPFTTVLTSHSQPINVVKTTTSSVSNEIQHPTITKLDTTSVTNILTTSLIPDASEAEAINQNVIINDVPSCSTASSHEPPSACSECSMVFSTGINLKKHIDLVHQGRQGGKKYQCAICSVEFDEKSELKDHVERHASEKPFKCDICGVRFTNQAGQKRHKLRLHDTKVKTHSCDKCGKQFFDKHDLKRHVKIHTKECNKCGRKLGNKEQHHNCVSQQKTNEEDSEKSKLSCTICGVLVSNKTSWGYHMWKHTKDPKYINISVDTDIIKSLNNKKDVDNTNKNTELNMKKNVTQLERSKDCDEKFIALDNVVQENASKGLGSNGSYSHKNILLPTESKNGTTCSSAVTKEQPNPPEAHATSQTSFCQITQPLCLQTSSRTPLLQEREMKPLNMQITNSES